MPWRKGLTCFLEPLAAGAVAQGRDKRKLSAHCVSITADCDARTRSLIAVEKDGPACHTGTESPAFMINPVYGRAGNCSEVSACRDFTGAARGPQDRNAPGGFVHHPTSLRRALTKFSKKWARSAPRSSSRARADDKKETVYELADLAYHVHGADGAKWAFQSSDVHKELASRHVS